MKRQQESMRRQQESMKKQLESIKKIEAEIERTDSIIQQYQQRSEEVEYVKYERGRSIQKYQTRRECECCMIF